MARVVTWFLGGQSSLGSTVYGCESDVGAHRSRASTSAKLEETPQEVTHFRHKASSSRTRPGPARIPGRTSGRRMRGTAARGTRRGGGREHGQKREDAPVVQRNQPPHRLERRPAVGAQDAVVADLLEPGGQDVLERTSSRGANTTNRSWFPSSRRDEPADPCAHALADPTRSPRLPLAGDVGRPADGLDGNTSDSVSKSASRRTSPPEAAPCDNPGKRKR